MTVCSAMRTDGKPCSRTAEPDRALCLGHRQQLRKPTDVAQPLAYAKHGFRVFPAFVIDGAKVPAGKDVLRVPCPAHPFGRGTKAALKACRSCKGGVRAATTDRGYIRRLWSERPTALVGAVPPAGTLVLDDDSHLFDLVWSHLPHVRTQSGKSHYWFRLGAGHVNLRSENGIEYGGPDGVVDIRTDDGLFFVMVPCGKSTYVAMNDWSPDPATWPVLDDEVFIRLCEAPRRTSGGASGTGGHGHSAGVEGVAVGQPLDYDVDTLVELLDLAGWTSDGDVDWVRPGKDAGRSATLDVVDGIAFLNVFSCNGAPLEAGRFYTTTMLALVLAGEAP